jgi:hypothetical protein
MYVPFPQLPDTSRVWIYTTNKVLGPSDQQIIAERLEQFVRSWQSHQKDVVASFTIIKNRFVVLATDDANQDVSGCGIDKSVHAIAALENELQISLLDKSTIYFEKDGEIFPVPLPKIKDAIASLRIDTGTFFYNTLVFNKKELNSGFHCPVVEGWTSRYFTKVNS